MARKKSVRVNFTSGTLDPLLANRTELPQYRAGLRTGTNVMLLPHGGFTRRPGCRFCRELTGLGDTQGRTSRFKFNLEQSYLLHWRDERVDIYQPTSSGGLSDTDRITRIRTPYGDEHIPDLDFRAQTADTQVIFHQSVPPHRLLRAALRAVDPIRTTVTSTVVRVYHPDHKLLGPNGTTRIDGDQIGLSGLEATGGIAATRLNTFHEISTVGDDFGAADIATTEDDETVVLDLGADYDLGIGDRIKLKGLSSIGGFSTSQLNRTHTITAVGSGLTANEVSIEMPLPAISSATGGTDGSWAMESFYQIDVGGSTVGITAANGGGTAGRAWVLHSLKPDDDREVCLKNIPQHDYLDGDSPQPKNAEQRLIFDNFDNGDSYKLSFSVPSLFGGSGALVPLPFLDWASTDISENARRIEAEYAAHAANISPVTLEVEYDEDASSGEHHEFILRFSPAVPIDTVDVVKIRTASGDDATINQSTPVEGGSTEEDVISDTRGWPSGGLFYQGRLWMYGLASRPSSIIGSKTNAFFNLDIGTATPSDAIYATDPVPEPILDMIEDRGLWALTTASEVSISGDEGPGITPSNITFTTASRYGTSGVPAVSVAGRPIYIDRTGRTVRQLGFVEASGAAESKDISILSQFLIGDPVAMDVWRNAYGDYAAVCMEDGSLVVLNINVDQAVAGWTKWTTDGDFVDVCESGDILYVIVSRSINGTDKYFLEAFDFNYHTDAGVIVLDPTGDNDGVWSGFSHLTGETVQVRQDGQTMASVAVSGGTVTAKMGDVTIVEGNVFEAGLAIPTPTAEPMPGAAEQYMAVTRVAVDMFESRAVFVDGYRLDEAQLGESLTGIPLVTGWREMNLMGWGDRETVALTFPEPQPATIRGITMEVALAA